MSQWLEIHKVGDKVIFADGTPLKVGEQVSMGLGSIELRDTERAGLHVVRLSGSGRFKYSLRLSRDSRYRLGSDWSHRVIPPEEEIDPIKRVLRKMEIPVSNLERATEPTLEVDERWYDNHHCPVGRPTNHWLHDGRKTIMTSAIIEEAHGQFSGGGGDTVVIEEATYAICIDSGRYMNGCEWSRPGRIVVWPNCEPEALANALARIHS